MTKKRKLLSLLLVFAVLFGCFYTPVSAFAASKPSKPSSLSVSSRSASSAKLKWKKVKGASGYVVYKYNSSKKKYSKFATTSSTSCTVKKLSSATVYTYAVKAYKKSGKKKYYSSYSKKLSFVTLPTAPASLSVSSVTSSQAVLSWKKVSRASGYKVQYSTDKNFKNSVKSVAAKSNSIKISSLSASKVYYFRVYAYKTYSSKNYYSSKSSSVSAKTKELYYATKSAVDESVTYQNITGFGASSAWWAQKVGSWSTAEDILTYLYSPDDGIGLNIYRYNVGTDSMNDEGITNYYERTEGFIDHIDGTQGDNGVWSDDAQIVYDWSKDAAAQNCLKIANKLSGGKLQLTLFSNSPPTQLTKNSKAYCSYNNGETSQDLQNSNLDRNNFALYSQFCVDVADHFVDEGYNVTDYSPVNEPQYEWACDSEGHTSQEGCHYTSNTLPLLYSSMAKAAAGKSYKISMFESGAAEGDNTTFSKYLDKIMLNSTNAAYYDSVSVHSYWSDKSTKSKCFQYLSSSYPTMSVACTEYCQMTNDTNTGVWEKSSIIEWWDETRNGLTIDYGVQMARVINEDLTVLNATQWNWWLGVSNGYYPDGLVYISHDDSDETDIKTSKRLWCLGNYSKFIQSGAVRVKISEAQSSLLSSAYKNPDGSLVIVYVNQTAKDLKTNVKASGYADYSVYETSRDKDLEQTQNGAYSYSDSINVPSQSVVTVVLNK